MFTAINFRTMLKKLAYLIIIIVGVYVLLQIPSVDEFAKNLKASVLDKVGNVTEEYKNVKEKVEDVSAKAKETKEKVDETVKTVNDTIDTVNSAVDSITETVDKVGSVLGNDEEKDDDKETATGNPQAETQE